jgi:uracil-DNA glycosylase family 4
LQIEQHETDSFPRLSREIIQCTKCPRLVEFREKVAREKRLQFANEEYWGRPVPGFGDEKSRVLVVGLAPAAHGGNRTGRVFTGDASAKFLVRALFACGFANQPTSERKDDGLEYKDAYVLAALRCVPPGNKPLLSEMENCYPYFVREMTLLENAKVVVALGKIAFDTSVKHMKKEFGIKTRGVVFKHGAAYRFGPDHPALIGCYHPSPRNTNTGTLSQAMMRRVFRKAKKIATESK